MKHQLILSALLLGGSSALAAAGHGTILQGGQQDPAEDTIQAAKIAFRVGGLMKTKSGAT